MDKKAKRPSSAPQAQRYVLNTGGQQVPKRPPIQKPNCAIKKPKRVVSGSTSAARITSKYHERCLPHWVPAPAKTTSKSLKNSKEASRRESYPLCLVCEYDHSCQEDSIHQLYEKFQKGAVKLEELDNEVKSKARTQKAKVLDALWQMDVEAKRKIENDIKAEKSKKSVKSKKSEASENDAPSWKEILKDKDGEKTDEDDNTSSISIPDVDLTPDKEWSLSEKILQTEALVHKESSEMDEKNITKPSQKVKKKVKKEPLIKTETKPKIIKGSPSSKLKKPSKKVDKPKKITEKIPAQPKGKIIHEIPRPVAKSNYGQDQIKQVEGINILTMDKDIDQVSRKESMVETTSFESQKSLSESACIQGTAIHLNLDRELISDPIGKWVDQCNSENNFGDATDPEFMPENQWKEQKANFKREQFKKRYSRTETKEDILKKFVDEEQEMMKQVKSDDRDVFSDIIIDELKRENRDLKFALVARNQRLEDAATKVTQLVEQNTYLCQKVEKAAFDHTKQVQELIETQKRYEVKIENLSQKLLRLEEKRFLDKSALDSSSTELEATIHDLTQRLKKSEESNKNLQIYIDNLKKSYHQVFNDDDRSSSLSHSKSQQ